MNSKRYWPSGFVCAVRDWLVPTLVAVTWAPAITAPLLIGHGAVKGGGGLRADQRRAPQGDQRHTSKITASFRSYSFLLHWNPQSVISLLLLQREERFQQVVVPVDQAHIVGTGAAAVAQHSVRRKITIDQALHRWSPACLR